MASIVIKRITDTADKLYEIRKAIQAKEEACKAELEVMKLERDAIQASLLAELNKNGLSSIKSSSGDSFSKSVRKSVEITSEPFALKWAIENRTVSINKTLVAQKLKEISEVPPGFEIVETEFISVRKAKQENHE